MHHEARLAYGMCSVHGHGEAAKERTPTSAPPALHRGLVRMSNMPSVSRMCHSAQHSAFRGRPLNTPVVGHSIHFALEYEGPGGAWLPVAWRMLVRMHGSSLHLVITSDDGDDYYHVHPQGKGEDGLVTAKFSSGGPGRIWWPQAGPSRRRT